MDYETPTHYDINTPTTLQTTSGLREQNNLAAHMLVTTTITYNSELNILYVPPKGALNHPLREQAVSVNKMKTPVLHPKQKVAGKSLCTTVNTTYYRMRSARQNRMT